RGHSGEVTSLAFSADGSLLASGSFDGTVRLWDPAAGRERSVLRGHADCVWAVAFAPDGGRLASGGQDPTVRLSDPATRPAPQRLTGQHGVRRLAFARDGKTLVVANEIGVLTRIDWVAGQGRGGVEAHGGTVYALALSPDGGTLATAAETGDPQGGLHRTHQ